MPKSVDEIKGECLNELVIEAVRSVVEAWYEDGDLAHAIACLTIAVDDYDRRKPAVGDQPIYDAIMKQIRRV